MRRRPGSAGARPLVLNGDRIVAEERFLTDGHQRVRDIRQSREESIYLLTGSGTRPFDPENTA
jgi:glucose/arabinose dehydrogenase